MPLLQANVPEIRQGLFSPGMKRFGQGAGRFASEYMKGLSNVASLPGRIYRGEAKPTQENAFDFAVNIAGGGLTGGFGKGGLGMGGRRLSSAKKLATPDDAILKRLGDTAKEQFKKGKPKFAKSKIESLTGQFQKQVFEYGRIPESDIKRKLVADQGLTKMAGEIVKYRKMLDKDWI